MYPLNLVPTWCTMSSMYHATNGTAWDRSCFQLAFHHRMMARGRESNIQYNNCIGCEYQKLIKKKVKINFNGNIS